jgi:hypothetical protein
MRTPADYFKELRSEAGGKASTAFLVLLFEDGGHDIVRSDEGDPLELLSGMIGLGGTPVIIGRVRDDGGIWELTFRILPEFNDDDFVQALGKAMLDTAKQISRQNLDAALKGIARATQSHD